MEDRINNQANSGKKYKKWFFVLVVVMILILGIGIYFFILVRQNIKNINTGNNTNQSFTGTVATTDDPYTGGSEAKIVIVEFGDFQCPFCYQSFPIIRELIDNYGDQIKWIYRDFPDSVKHPHAQKAAEAGECAQEQGKFWEMHDKMFINQTDLTVAALKRYAEEISLEISSFNDCLDSGKYENEVLQDFTDGYYAGVRGTPTFFINNRKFEGVVPLEDFKSIIDQLIALSR